MSAIVHLALASAGGILLYLASPGPHQQAWLAWVALVPLFFVVHQGGIRRAIGAGLACGLAFYLPLLGWIHTVLATYGGLPTAQAMAATGLLAGYMALYPALFAVGIRRLPLLAAPVLWVGLDVLRGLLFTGFPWMDLGYDLYRQTPLLQVAAVTGHHGLTFCLVLANAILATVLIRRRWTTGGTVGLLVLTVALGGAVWRYQHLAGRPPQATMTVGIVQGNIDQDRKWIASELSRAIDRHLSLTGAVVRQHAPDLVVWPETALPLPPNRLPGFLPALSAMLAPSGTALLTGVPWEEPGPRYTNRAILLAPDGRITGHYDKQHLVPFGEYIPLRGMLPIDSPVVESMADFSPGQTGSPLACGPARLGVLICFESIFPQLARQTTAQGADLLVNITNDAWFGRSNAPWQHFAMAVLRAVENHRSLVRAANTGISGAIDPLGRVTATTGLFVPATLAVTVERSTADTPYGRGGHWFGIGCLVGSVVLVAAGAARGF